MRLEILLRGERSVRFARNREPHPLDQHLGVGIILSTHQIVDLEPTRDRSLGTGEAFRNGRQFSAYLGLTPKQYSSGGKTNIVGISKKVANKRLRSVLIQGARSYVHKLKEPGSPKDQWLWSLIQRAGHGKAAVALANKNVRTAWALLTEGTEYDRQRGRLQTA